MPTLVLGNRNVTYSKTGSGTPVVLVHGSFATSSAWRRIISSMDLERFCAIAIDLPGCGGSDPVALEPSRLLALEAETVRAVLIKEAAEPAQLVAHSYGAVIALSLALAGRDGIGSLTLFEPLPFTFLEKTGDAQIVDEIAAFVAEYRGAFQLGDEWAARRVIDLWGGEGAFAAMPAQVQQVVKANTAQNICQWETNLGFRPSIEDYRSLHMPTTLVRGEKSHPIGKLISERLHQLIPASKLVEIPAASHFMIHTHAMECAKIIDPAQAMRHEH